MIEKEHTSGKRKPSLNNIVYHLNSYNLSTCVTAYWWIGDGRFLEILVVGGSERKIFVEVPWPKVTFSFRNNNIQGNIRHTKFTGLFLRIVLLIRTLLALLSKNLSFYLYYHCNAEPTDNRTKPCLSQLPQVFHLPAMCCLRTWTPRWTLWPIVFF